MHPRLYAAVDLGTNTAKLTVGRLDAGGAVVREHYEAVAVRLGEDLACQGQIGPLALRRTLDCLEGFAARLDDYALDGLKAISTSALRRALNAEDVLTQIAARTGLKFEVISGEEEARLCLEALSARPDERLAVMNCGGGSTQVAWLTLSGPAGLSLELGALELSRRFLKTDPPRYVELRWLMDEIGERLAAVECPGLERLVAQGGSALNLAGLGGGCERLSKLELSRQVKLLMQLDHAARCNLNGLEPARADTILAGALIHLRMLEQLKLDELEISKASIIDGLICIMALKLM